ncbi:MAG: class I SAM-dependent methyltransferase [Parcubacteria group bacterium]|nr:class I SAM-dependent methyltransferase [Parcubacteria group bacterium]
MQNNTYQVWKKIQQPINEHEFLVGKTLAHELAGKHYRDIAIQYIFITPEDVEKTFKLLPLAWDSFQGRGVDLGGGIACISSIIARKEEVKDIHCVEYTEELVKLCQPIIKQSILGDRADKIVSVVGDFNNLELPDASMDFAVSWDSIHHSYEPVKTLSECRRVLKKGGRLVIIDRAHNNSTPDSEIERMLNIVYDKEYLRKNYLDENMTLTRRDNGEHEWRYQELEHFFIESGFKLLSRVAIKTDTPDNRALKNDVGDVELLVPFNMGGFGHRKVGFVLEAL